MRRFRAEDSQLQAGFPIPAFTIAPCNFFRFLAAVQTRFRRNRSPGTAAPRGQPAQGLYAAGLMRQIWRRCDTPGAAILWEASSEAEVRAPSTSAHQSGRNAGSHVFCPLAPYPALCLRSRVILSGVPSRAQAGVFLEAPLGRTLGFRLLEERNRHGPIPQTRYTAET